MFLCHKRFRLSSAMQRTCFKSLQSAWVVDAYEMEFNKRSNVERQQTVVMSRTQRVQLDAVAPRPRTPTMQGPTARPPLDGRAASSWLAASMLSLCAYFTDPHDWLELSQLHTWNCDGGRRCCANTGQCASRVSPDVYRIDRVTDHEHNATVALHASHSRGSGLFPDFQCIGRMIVHCHEVKTVVLGMDNYI